MKKLILDLTGLNNFDLFAITYLVTGFKEFLPDNCKNLPAIIPLEKTYPDFSDLLLTVIQSEIINNRQKDKRTERTLLLDEIDNQGQAAPIPANKLGQLKNWCRSGQTWAGNFEELKGTAQLLASIEQQL